MDVVFVGDDAGIIRFRGKLEGKEGEFLGIEWFCPSRGTHDGVYNGKRYFSCKQEGGKGSFVKSTSKNIFAPCSAVQALKEKYGSVPHLEDEFVLTKREEKVLLLKFSFDFVVSWRSQVKIEMVGMEDISYDLNTIDTVSLSNMKISEVEANFMSHVPSLTDLDLSMNAIISLPSVLQSCSSLKSLNISKNPLHLGDSAQFKLGELSLTTLAVTGTEISWDSLKTCLEHCSNLRVLDVSDNPSLEGVPDDLCVWLPRLKSLHLVNVGMSDWAKQLKGIDGLQELEALFVSQNPISSVPPLNLPSLQVLTVSETKLDGFDWVVNLRDLKQLRSLKYQNTATHGLPKSRIRLVAHLTQLQQLNGADISERERQDAMIVGTEKESSGGSSSSACVSEPLYLVFSSPNGSVSDKIKVSPFLTLKMVCDLAFKYTKIPPYKQKIWTKVKEEVGRALLDQMEYTLEWYGYARGEVDVLVEEDDEK